MTADGSSLPPGFLRGAVVGTVVVVIGAAVSVLVHRRQAGGPADVPGRTPATTSATGPSPAAGAAARPTAASPAGPDIAPTRDACVAFLLARAAVAAPAPSSIDAFLEIRPAALEALGTLRPDGFAAVLDAVLAGDGDADDWNEARFAAARIAAAAGDPRATALLRAFLALPPDDMLFDTAVAAAAAEVAALVPAPDGPRMIARILAEDPDQFADDEIARVARAAATAASRDAEGSLRKLLAEEDRDMEARGAAAGALLRLGDAAGEALVATVIQEDATFDGEALAAGLAAPGNADVLPWLRRLLATEDSLVRAAAARAMGAVGVAGAREDLLRALGDDDQDVRHEAGIALVRIGDAAGLPAARAAARENGDGEIRIRAWRALALAGDAASRPAAEEVLARPLPPAGQGKTHDLFTAAMEKIWAARLVAGLP